MKREGPLVWKCGGGPSLRVPPGERSRARGVGRGVVRGIRVAWGATREATSGRALGVGPWWPRGARAASVCASRRCDQGPENWASGARSRDRGLALGDDDEVTDLTKKR